MKLKLFTMLFCLFFISLSCDKDTSPEQNNSFNVSIISPSNGDSISSFPIQISLSITNPENISYIQIKLNDNIIDELTQFNDTENIAYSPSPSTDYNGAILTVYAFSNFDESSVSQSITINFSTVNELLVNNTIALLPANDFLFTKNLITNTLYVDFLNNINLIGNIISTTDSTNWLDQYENPILDIEKTHLSYDSSLNVFTVNDGYDLHPISGISWYGADLFASYMGWKLPTIEQWKYIARADSVTWVYPYEDGNTINQSLANFGNAFGSFATTEVGSYNQLSALGATDIVGNVWEFTSSNHIETNKQILVGGSYQSTIDNVCLLDTCFTTIDPNIISSTFGFRCIADLNYNAPTLDCNNDVSTASIDDCGECTGGITGLEANYLMDFCGICNGDGSTCADCNGDENGAALIDECGECTGGNTGLETNYLMDCAGNCNGDSLLDNCGTCDNDLSNDCAQDCANNWGGNAYLNECGSCVCGPGEYINCETINLCGCFDITSDNFSCHLDPEACYEDNANCCTNGLYGNCTDICIVQDNSTNQIFFSNPLEDDDTCTNDLDDGFEDYDAGCTIYENEYHDDLEHDPLLCEFWGCTDSKASNYDVNATNCVDQTMGENSTCCEYNFISLGIDNNNDTQLNIFMQNSDIVGGFQITISGTTFASSSGSDGSAAAAGFAVSASSNLILGFSLSGSTIPASNTPILLTSIPIQSSESICIDSFVISDITGSELLFINDSSCE